MKAVILMAGKGTRLHPITLDTQKSMIKIGDKTILEHMLHRLVDCGIDEIILVVGYRHEDIKKKMGDEFCGAKILYVLNPVYDKTNNIYSLYLAKDHIEDGILIVNGDDVVNKNILKAILESEHKNAAVVDDSNTDLPEEAMKVTVFNGKIIDIGKTIPKHKAHGDAIGVYKLSPEGAKVFFEEIEKFIDRGETNVFYLHAMKELLKKMDVRMVSTKGLSWFEIDDHNDLKEAHNIIIKIIEEESS